MPALDAFTVQAVADEEVTVFGALAPSCHSTQTVNNSKTVTCGGGGATYVAEARGPLSVVGIYVYHLLQ